MSVCHTVREAKFIPIPGTFDLTVMEIVLLFYFFISGLYRWQALHLSYTLLNLSESILMMFLNHHLNSSTFIAIHPHHEYLFVWLFNDSLKRQIMWEIFIDPGPIV